MQLQEADGAAQVAKHHQFLAEDLDPMGRSFSSSEKQIGCQKRRKYSPHGVSGPTWESSTSSSGTSR
jgi:hypothetical protein